MSGVIHYKLKNDVKSVGILPTYHLLLGKMRPAWCTVGVRVELPLSTHFRSH
jgi:hypothetical protein